MPILNGTSGPDVLSATAGSLESWTLNGLDGDDTLSGGDANDILDGGAGADIMRGYWGFDIYYVDNAGDQVIDGDGNEIRTTLATYSLPALIWKLTGQLATGQTPDRQLQRQYHHRRRRGRLALGRLRHRPADRRCRQRHLHSQGL